MKANDMIGKRIKIIGDHPHSGERGSIVAVKTTAIGKAGWVVKLEGCPHGTDECFVFNVRNIQVVRR